MSACLANFCFKLLHSNIKLFLFKKTGDNIYNIHGIRSITICATPTLNVDVDVSNIHNDGELLKKLLPKCSAILTNNVTPLFLLTFYLHLNDTLHKGIKKMKT